MHLLTKIMQLLGLALVGLACFSCSWYGLHRYAYAFEREETGRAAAAAIERSNFGDAEYLVGDIVAY